MFTSDKRTYRLVSFIIILSITLAGFQPAAVSVQSRDGLKRQLSARESYYGPMEFIA